MLTFLDRLLPWMEKLAKRVDLAAPVFVIVVLVETALITSPVGMNLFVVQSLRKGGSMNAVILGSQPFVLALFAMVALLAVFPDLAMWLPRVFAG